MRSSNDPAHLGRRVPPPRCGLGDPAIWRCREAKGAVTGQPRSEGGTTMSPIHVRTGVLLPGPAWRLGLLVVAWLLMGGCPGGGLPPSFGDYETQTRTVRVEVTASSPVRATVDISGVEPFEAQTPISRGVVAQVLCVDNPSVPEPCSMTGSAEGPPGFSGTLSLCLTVAGERKCETGRRPLVLLEVAGYPLVHLARRVPPTVTLTTLARRVARILV
jgi:hypothetical protein